MAPEWPESPGDPVDPALAPLIEAGEGERIRRNAGPTIPHTDDERRDIHRSGDHLSFLLDGDDGILPLEQREDASQRLGDIAPATDLHAQQVGDNFGVGLGSKIHKGIEQEPQFGSVLDDAVVDDGDSPGGIEMRMGIRFGDSAVGGPPGVSDCDS